MNRKALTILIVAVLAVAGILFYLKSGDMQLALPDQVVEDAIPETPVPQGTPTQPVIAAAAPTAATAPSSAVTLPPLGAPPIVTGDGMYQKNGVGEWVLNDRIMGDKNAPLTIVEYASLTCPHCAHFHAETLPQLKAQYLDTGKAKLVFRAFPFDQIALKATRLAWCVPETQFQGFLETLYKAQENWAHSKDTEAELVKLARLAGLPEDKAKACLADENLGNAIMRTRLLAERDIGIRSTPTFVIHGEKIEGAKTFAEFDNVLSSVAQKAGMAPKAAQ